MGRAPNSSRTPALFDRDEDWMADGLCHATHPDVFFPVTDEEQQVAARMCGPCPVRQRRLEYAIANKLDHGIWGGTTEAERRRIIRPRRRSRVS